MFVPAVCLVLVCVTPTDSGVDVQVPPTGTHVHVPGLISTPSPRPTPSHPATPAPTHGAQPHKNSGSGGSQTTGGTGGQPTKTGAQKPNKVAPSPSNKPRQDTTPDRSRQDATPSGTMDNQDSDDTVTVTKKVVAGYTAAVVIISILLSLFFAWLGYIFGFRDARRRDTSSLRKLREETTEKNDRH